MKLIGIAAQKQNGKDTLADYLLETSLIGWDRRAWADGVKKTASDIFGVSLDFIEEWKENPNIPPGWNMTMRQSLQLVGDGMRKVKSDCWLEYSTRNRKVNTLITDGRYLNELVRVKELGGINVLVYRPGFINEIDHPSEAQMRPIVKFYVEMKWEGPVELRTLAIDSDVPEGAEHIDYVIWNDGDLSQFNQKADAFMSWRKE